jgi:hypothetical protein
MTKIEKLKEVNTTLKKILIDMETRIFVENIDVEDRKRVNEPQQKVAVKLN